MFRVIVLYEDEPPGLFETRTRSSLLELPNVWLQLSCQFPSPWLPSSLQHVEKCRKESAYVRDNRKQHTYHPIVQHQSWNISEELRVPPKIKYGELVTFVFLGHIAYFILNLFSQPSTSSATSDEKVDYVQVDKEKTQALQNTMQEWTDVRQSSEPAKGIKSWQSATMLILAAWWNTQCTWASLSLHFPSDWCAMKYFTSFSKTQDSAGL